MKNIWYSPKFDLNFFRNVYYSFGYVIVCTLSNLIYFDHLNNFGSIYVHNIVYKCYYGWFMYNIILRIVACDILAQNPQVVDQE